VITVDGIYREQQGLGLRRKLLFPSDIVELEFASIVSSGHKAYVQIIEIGVLERVTGVNALHWVVVEHFLEHRLEIS
jgi:hypothetical protein